MDKDEINENTFIIKSNYIKGTFYLKQLLMNLIMIFLL